MSDGAITNSNIKDVDVFVRKKYFSLDATSSRWDTCLGPPIYINLTFGNVVWDVDLINAMTSQ
jgi:hypothetical protein